LVALGSVYYQPLLVFYRAAAPVQLLSEFAGQRLAIGPVGSGARSLALTLLASNGLATNGLAADGKTTLLAAPADEATAGLLAGQVDAVFLMGDSASVDVMRKLMRNPEIQLLDFVQADAYSRRIDYLNKLTIPRGCMDFGRNIPAQDVHLLAPAIELVARPHLHPALSDILLEAATEVHGNASIFRRRGEFPAPLERDFHLSADATRYYKSGKSFLYRTLPFWVASLVNRVIVVFVPMLMILIPGLRLIPAVYKWRLRLRIYRWYRALLVLEGNLATPTAGVSRDEMLRRLDEIERAVDQLKMPASFADQFYALRGHISWVRARLREGSLPR
jgi:hypothetical protein